MARIPCPHISAITNILLSFFEVVGGTWNNGHGNDDGQGYVALGGVIVERVAMVVEVGSARLQWLW